MLLTFKNVRNEAGKGNDIFNQATSTLVDMSTALGSDPQKQAVQLGKALNDPTKGISALSKVGVTFTDSQKKVIERLQETGHTAKAQKVILKELNSEFGGSAKAAGDTAAGQLKHFKDTLDGVFESIVRKAIPVLVKITQYLSVNVPKALQAAQPYIDKLKAAFEKVSPVLGQFFNFLKNNKTVVAAFAGTILLIVGSFTLLNAVMAVNPISLVVIAIAALAAGLVYAYKHSERFKAIVDTTFKFLKQVIPPVINFIVNFVKNHWQLLVTIIGGPLALVVIQVVKHWNKIKSVTQAAWNFIKDYIVSPIKAAVGGVKSAVSAVGNAISTAWNAVKSATKAAWDGIKNGVVNGVQAVVNKVKEIKGKVTGALSGAATWLYDLGRSIIQGLLDGIESLLGKVTEKISSLKDKVKSVATLGGLLGRGVVDPFQFVYDAAGTSSDALEPALARVEATIVKHFDDAGKKAADALKKHMKAAGKSPDAIKDALDRLGKHFDHLQAKAEKALKPLYAGVKKATKAVDAANAALATQQDILDGLKQQAVDYATTVKDAFNDFANITSLDVPFTSEGIINGLTAKLEQAKAFAAAIQQLIAQGLNQTSLQQIIAAGPEAGLAYAQAIAAGGAGAIGQINVLQGQIEAAGQGLGNGAAQSFYGAGINAQQALVDGMTADADALIAAATKLAKALVRAVKKALGIKSPSRVFKLIGEYTTKGLVNGLADISDVKTAGARLGEAVADGYSAPSFSANSTGGTFSKSNAETVQITINMPVGVTSTQADRMVKEAVQRAYSNEGKRVQLTNA